MYSKYLIKLAAELFDDAQSRERFAECVMNPCGGVKSLIWIKDRPAQIPFKLLPKTSFEPEFVDAVAADETPGSQDLHEEGYYYCLDRSSVFSASAISEIKLSAPRILDMCASPGGKSIFAFRALKPSLMISNEVIGKRLGALISNLKRLGIAPVSVTSSDSKVWANQCAQAFDVVLADVPCSGQSLIRKASEAPGCFHPATVNMNSNRQKRILANSLQTVAPGGYLSYMTCTFSPAENERVIEWALKKFPNFMPTKVAHLIEFQSTLTERPCYRLWPQQGLGAGGFVCLLKNTQELLPAEEPSPELPRAAWRA